jgi:hypothetical protein
MGIGCYAVPYTKIRVISSLSTKASMDDDKSAIAHVLSHVSGSTI